MGVDQTISVKHAQNLVPSAISRIRSTMTLRRSDIEALETPNDYSNTIYKINRTPSNNSLAMGFRVLRRMRDQGIRFNTLSQYNQLMWFYSQHRQISPLWKTFKNILRIYGKVNVITYNHLLIAFGEANFKVISLLLNQMKAHHIEPNTVTYNILLRLLAKQDNLMEMLKVYQVMTDWRHPTTNEESSQKTSVSILPNEYTYTTLMHVAAKLGHTELLEKLNTLMQQNNISENAVLYTIRINAMKLPLPDPMTIEPWRDRRPMSEETRQQYNDILNSDKRLMDEMQEKRITPTQHTYTSLMSRAFKCGQQKLALEYYIQMICAGISPDIVSYGTLYYGLGLTNSLEMAEQYHQEMRNQFIPQGLIYKTILAYVKSRYGYHRDAIAILEPYLFAGQLDIKAATTLLTCYARARNLNAALRAWKRMLFQYSVTFANKVHRPLLMAFARRGETRVVRWLFSRTICVQNTQLLPEEMIYALLRSYAQRGQAKDAIELWRQALYLGIKFTPYMITQLLMACSVGRDIESLAIIKGDLKTLEISLNEYQLSVFIVGLARTGQADLCKELYRQSLERGLWLKEWVHLACGNVNVHLHDIYFMYNSKRLSQ
jgi:pentatricopeptide repeat domain-containing protein 1